MLFQLLLLLLSEALCIARLSLERQRVERILRTLLMEYVLLSILPIWKRLLISRCTQDGLALVDVFAHLLLLYFGCEGLEIVLGSRLEVHLVRIYYFSFLLKIEALAVLHDNCLGKTVLEVASVPRAHGLRVRIADEAISDARLTASSVPADSRAVHQLLRLSIEVDSVLSLLLSRCMSRVLAG